MKNNKQIKIEVPTPKESNVYSKVRYRPACDSFGVESGYERSICYKHAIPPGLASQGSCKFIVLHSGNEEGLFSQVPFVVRSDYHLPPVGARFRPRAHYPDRLNPSATLRVNSVEINETRLEPCLNKE